MATVEVYILTPNFHSDVMGEKEEFSTTMIATAVSYMSLEEAKCTSQPVYQVT